MRNQCNIISIPFKCQLFDLFPFAYVKSLKKNICEESSKKFSILFINPQSSNFHVKSLNDNKTLEKMKINQFFVKRYNRIR